jgi:hypothetical protein
LIMFSFFLSSSSCCIFKALLSSKLCKSRSKLRIFKLMQTHKDKLKESIYFNVGINQAAYDVLSSVAADIPFKLRESDTL